jgi:hypothetical protein
VSKTLSVMIDFCVTFCAAHLDVDGGCTCLQGVLYRAPAEGNQLHCHARRCAGVSDDKEGP